MGQITPHRFGFYAMKSWFFLIFLSVSTVFATAPLPPTPEEMGKQKKGVYFGAYMDFGETEDDVTLEGIEKFETMLGRSPLIIASSSYWGEQTFPSKNLELIARHGAVPMIFWSPWDRPYEQKKGPDRFALTEILAGKWDAYIDLWGDGAKKFEKPFFVSFCNEMNGSWFPWSGCFYGGEDGGNEVFKKAWRYVVDRVRARGGTNVRWVFHVNAYSSIYEDWNMMGAYYPGAEYVDWLGLSVYGKQFHGSGDWAFFKDMLQWPYEDITKIDPDKPVMLAEFGVGDYPKAGNKAQWIRDAFHMIPRKPRIKAAIYWHERWQNEDGTFSNLRVNSSNASLKAFHEGLENPKWISIKKEEKQP